MPTESCLQFLYSLLIRQCIISSPVTPASWPEQNAALRSLNRPSLPVLGLPSSLWHPFKYAKELARKARTNGARVYLVNTGWNGTGKRISIKDTRAIIDDILSGSILKGATKKIPYFDLEIPINAEGAHAEILNPRNTYKDPSEWDRRAEALAAKFIENFKKFSATNEECKRLEKFGPHLD